MNGGTCRRSALRMNASLHLYRQLLREAKGLTAAQPVGRKVAFNTREVFEARRDERDPAAVARMHGDAQAALRAIAWLKALPPVRGVHSGHVSHRRRTAELQADAHGSCVVTALELDGCLCRISPTACSRNFRQRR